MKEQAQKVMKAFYKDDSWDKEPLPGKIVVANVLRQTINELQQSPGVIMCADVLELCEELEKCNVEYQYIKLKQGDQK